MEVKHLHKTNPSCVRFKTYNETPIFIPVDITEDEVKSLTQKLWGSYGSGGTDSEALQGWILKFGEDRKRLNTIMETFVDWLSNGSPSWEAYHAFMSGCLIAFDKQPGVHSVGFRETWRRLFDDIFLKFAVTEATMECQDDHLCAELKARINGAVNGVQDIWDENSTT